ncbi:MAG: TonB-dependent receptor [Bacteroidia bacterium]|nr:TonB-dependent receptor [Bacteroidia bacterium]
MLRWKAWQWLPVWSLLMAAFGPVMGQVTADSSVKLDEVLISAYRDSKPRESSIHLESLSKRNIEQQGSFNLTDAMARIPGVSQLSTGPFISKPVVRGLFGNRILVLLSGLRFDNQQWQDEHGLGLSDMGIARVELIKGPLSLLYGTDAIGGVINIIEEAKADSGAPQLDAGIEFHSNTLGETVQVGYKANQGRSWFRLRGAVSSHADYSDGDGTRVFNSRFQGYFLKGSYGFRRRNMESQNDYTFSFSNFGFVFDGLGQTQSQDARWSRSMTQPHHIVMLHIFSSQNKFSLPHSRLELTGGLQSNYRAEDEGGGKLSLIMHLMTGQYALKWRKNLGKATEMVLANLGSVENNSNFGGRKIVPDAWMGESTLSAYFRHTVGKSVVEYGAGGGFRGIKTLLTPTVNTPDKDIDPFTQGRWFGNGMAGLCLNPTRDLSLRLNAATGVRAPNLAELSSNGLHEGIYTYEIGDPTMKNEQNLNGELGLDYDRKWFSASVSGFANLFRGYIYLDPTDEDWFGFPVFRFRQHDARIVGAEARVGVKPPLIAGLEVSGTWAGLRGTLDNGEFLPYMPAQKLTPEVRYTFRGSGGRRGYAFVNCNFVFSQLLTAPEEAPTASYQLLNGGAGMEFPTPKAMYSVGIAGNNLLNQTYFDHMSRYKNFGLNNMGLDLSLNFKITFLQNH